MISKHIARVLTCAIVVVMIVTVLLFCFVFHTDLEETANHATATYGAEQFHIQLTEMNR